MYPPSSSARTRRRQGGAEMPTRRASSTLVIRPLSCSSRRISRSISSRRAATGASGPGFRCPRRPSAAATKGPLWSPMAAGAKDYCVPELQIPLAGPARPPNCASPGLRILHSWRERLNWGPRRHPPPNAWRRRVFPAAGLSMAKTTHTKVAIIGSGPAGYAAAIYAALAMLERLLIQGIQRGGQLDIKSVEENYPGFPDGIQGPRQMEQMQRQEEHVGTRLVADHVNAVDLDRRPFRLVCDSGDVYLADSLILATGAQARWL